MGNCCSSKKGRQEEESFENDLNSMTLEDLKHTQINGGVFGQEPEGMSFKYQDDMMDNYI